MSSRSEFYRPRIILITASVLVGLVTCAFVNRLINFFLFSMFFGVAATLVFAFLFARKKISAAQTTNKEIESIYLALISGLLTYSFLFTVPMTIDRSFSVWSINQLYKSQETSEKQITRSSLSDSLSAFFDKDSDELQRRIREQITIGNFRIDRGEVISLTMSGLIVRQFIFATSVFFGLNEKYSR